MGLREERYGNSRQPARHELRLRLPYVDADPFAAGFFGGLGHSSRAKVRVKHEAIRRDKPSDESFGERQREPELCT